MFAAMVSELVYGPFYRRSLHRSAAPLTPAQQWVLAAGANLARLNGSGFGTLHTRRTPTTNRFILRDSWSVHDEASLRQTLDWLEQEGHRTIFRTLYRNVLGLTREELAAGCRRDPDNAALYEFVWNNRERFRNGDLVAWDYGRFINVVRYAVTGGLLAERDAWRALFRAGRVMQREYRSWAELSDNYILGLGYWQNGAPTELTVSDAVDWLLNDPESPWKRLPWDLELISAD